MKAAWECALCGEVVEGPEGLLAPELDDHSAIHMRAGASAHDTDSQALARLQVEGGRRVLDRNGWPWFERKPSEHPNVEAFFDGEMTEQDADAVRLHVAMCQRCEAELTGLAQLQALGADYLQRALCSCGQHTQLPSRHARDCPVWLRYLATPGGAPRLPPLPVPPILSEGWDGQPEALAAFMKTEATRQALEVGDLDLGAALGRWVSVPRDRSHTVEAAVELVLELEDVGTIAKLHAVNRSEEGPVTVSLRVRRGGREIAAIAGERLDGELVLPLPGKGPADG